MPTTDSKSTPEAPKCQDCGSTRVYPNHAPDLLAALEGYMSGHRCSDTSGDQCPTLIAAQDAIAKARGGQQ